MTNSPNSSANNEVWWTEGSWTGVVTPRAVMILPPSVPQDLTERLWRLLRSEEASLTRALDELVMGMGGRLGAIPDFVLAVSAPEDVFHVALRGAPQMEVDGKALDASAVTTWFETTVTAPNSLIVSAPGVDRRAAHLAGGRRRCEHRPPGAAWIGEVERDPVPQPCIVEGVR